MEDAREATLRVKVVSSGRRFVADLAEYSGQAIAACGMLERCWREALSLRVVTSLARAEAEAEAGGGFGLCVRDAGTVRG
jgi:hypothetical protein